ncbi:MAG: tetratricopeptide repeat protein, partial [Spirochaetaceae bacterium]|nr:tetratricopeptide repeat protein [Spirochaetaceae bacterium]
SFGAYSNLGQLASLSGELPKAERLMKRAISLNPEYHQGYYYLGIILFEQKKYDEAREYWNRLEKMVGDYKKLKGYMSKLAPGKEVGKEE